LLGEEGVEELLAQTINVAVELKRGDLNFGAESRVSSRGLTRIRSNLLEPTRTIP
jgi:hypothetical protein